jgi:hypothetical protein
MTNQMHHAPLTCAEFESRLQDYLEHDVDNAMRARMDAHRAECVDCHALTAELQDLAAQAANLPDLSPSRDLWDGIANRIEAEVVEFPVTPLPGEVRAVVPTNGGPVYAEYVPSAERPSSHVLPRPAVSRSYFRLAAAASILVAVTAGVTWSVASRSNSAGSTAAAADSAYASAMEGTRGVSNVARLPLDVTYDTEIASLRKIVDERRADIDSTTLAVLERNLKVIDDAIADCKTALAASPTSNFLMERLTDAYDTKLRTLRAVVTAAPRG